MRLEGFRRVQRVTDEFRKLDSSHSHSPSIAGESFKYFHMNVLMFSNVQLRERERERERNPHGFIIYFFHVKAFSH